MSRVLFRGANLLDGDNPPVEGMSVLVDGERINRVAPDGELSANDAEQVMDLAGATLMPGMTQAHWHGSYEGLDFTPPPVGLEKPPGYLMLLSLKNAQLALSLGYTSLIGAAVGDALDAQLKQAIEDGVVEGPRITAGSRWIITTGDCNDDPNFHWWGITSMGSQRICDGPYEFRRGVRQEIKEGAEVIKIFADGGHALIYGKGHTAMSQDELDAVVEATHARGKKVRSHCDTKEGILQAIAAGVDLIDHADEMDEECIDAVIASGTYVCPSMYLPVAILERLVRDGDGLENLPMGIAMQEDLKSMSTMLPLAARKGAKFMVGDDWGTSMTPHGDYNKELELYVSVGVPALDVIRWATKHAPEFIGMGDELGTISEGKLADLLVVSSDPSKDISVLGNPDNFKVIMKGGQFIKAMA
jgi:imidazolonepropionase-like amidohydrolase